VDEGHPTALLGRHAVRHLVPGAAIGVLREGSATTACYGAADVRTGEPVTSGTRFSAGSLTKSMAATVIAGLAEAGRLSLDDPVAGHVPELPSDGWAGRATVRDLLANRSGLALRAGLEFGFDSRKDEDDGALARLVADAAAGVPAGGFWSYPNVGWCVLGRVIETAAAAAWEQAMRRHLLERAGMGETIFVTRGASQPRAPGHEITAEGPVPAEPLTARAYGPAGTSVVTTITDLLRFAALDLEDPSRGVLRAGHAEVPIHGWLDSWCLGWARFDWGSGQVWGWDGLVNGERSVLRLVPERQAAVVLMTNGSTGRAMYRSLVAELPASLFAISVPPLRLDASRGAAGDLSRFAGAYAWPDRPVEVTATANGLLIKRDDRETQALPLDQRTFLVDPADPDNPAVTFGAFDTAGRPQVLHEMLWGLPRLGG
jgi:CubicO group peptidase (beta-lactamase class C family)